MSEYGISLEEAGYVKGMVHCDTERNLFLGEPGGFPFGCHLKQAKEGSPTKRHTHLPFWLDGLHVGCWCPRGVLASLGPARAGEEPVGMRGQVHRFWWLPPKKGGGCPKLGGRTAIEPCLRGLDIRPVLKETRPATSGQMSRCWQKGLRGASPFQATVSMWVDSVEDV